MSAAGPYSIGSDIWPGISKLVEEMGEVGQVIGKVMGTGGDIEHWDGGPPLDERLTDELADLMAAIDFVTWANDLDAISLSRRAGKKMAQFQKWHFEQALAPKAGTTEPSRSPGSPHEPSSNETNP